jgi:hypothetical protein
VDSEPKLDIPAIEDALRSTLETIEVATAQGSDTTDLVTKAHELADQLRYAVDRLGGDDEENEGTRRMAAWLEAKLAVFQNKGPTAH